MPVKKITDAIEKPWLGDEDRLPVGVPGDATAYCVTGAALFSSLPAATTSTPGVVELASGPETAALSDESLAVTPGGLASALGPAALAPGYLYAGKSAASLSRTAITALFKAAFGRSPTLGDACTLEDGAAHLHLLAYHSTGGRWYGMDLTGKLFEAF